MNDNRHLFGDNLDRIIQVDQVVGEKVLIKGFKKYFDLKELKPIVLTPELMCELGLINKTKEPIYILDKLAIDYLTNTTYFETKNKWVKLDEKTFFINDLQNIINKYLGRDLKINGYGKEIYNYKKESST